MLILKMSCLKFPTKMIKFISYRLVSIIFWSFVTDFWKLDVHHYIVHVILNLKLLFESKITIGSNLNV